jgi:hypothetical protein
VRLKLHHAHSWDLSLAEARELHGRLVPLGRARGPRAGTIGHVAGMDVGFEAGGLVTRAAVSVWSWLDLAPVQNVLARGATTFPQCTGPALISGTAGGLRDTGQQEFNTVSDQFPMTGVPLMDAESSSMSSSSMDMIWRLLSTLIHVVPL